VKRLNALAAKPAYLDRYVAIRDKKHEPTKTQLVAAHALVIQRYQDYAQAVAQGSLHTLKPSAAAVPISAALRACYGSATQPLKALKKAIQDAQPPRQLKYCPMCGTTLPKTFDHYLPTAKFPEFAVHALNLVPCCALCNSIKEDDWLSTTGGRLFLHAFLDTLPDAQFVHVTLHETPALNGVGATFSLYHPATVPNALWRLIESHFTRLNLLARYDERGNDEIAEILADCRVFSDTSEGGDVGAFLLARAMDRVSVHGRNHWIAALMKCLAEHPKLLAWVSAA
jgi:hypothetical protein